MPTGWVFTDIKEWVEKSEAAGLRGVQAMKKNPHGTPFLHFFYDYVAQNDGCPDKNRFVFDGCAPIVRLSSYAHEWRPNVQPWTTSRMP